MEVCYLINLWFPEALQSIGPVLQLPIITKDQAGAYLCIASVRFRLFNFLENLITLLNVFISEWHPAKCEQTNNCDCQLWVTMRKKTWIFRWMKNDHLVNFKITFSVKPKLFVNRRVVHSSIGQEVQLECLSESYPNSGNCWKHFEYLEKVALLIINVHISKLTTSVNYWIRGHADHSNRDSYLGGNIDSVIDSDGIYRVTMRHYLKMQKMSDFGIYKCVAKNALGTSEEIMKILRKSLSFP